ncbi:hypothetical protein MKW92_003326 [Papaver armeniacum]|nr:hypothetical protein MKW92_003326 [Papaver armeniacum]
MISAISWVPKGIAKVIPAEVQPPTKEEIDEILKSGTLNRREDSDNEDNEEMDVGDAAKGVSDEISQALAAAEALGIKQPRSSTSFGTKDITDALKELNMENYDEEDDGIEIFSTAIGDRYYPSNEMDPYLKKDDEDDEEEIEDMTIKPSDAVIVSVGTLDPAIEIWDLNLIDEIQPFLVLGGRKTAKDKEGSHTDSVLGLDWNKKSKYLASASADKSVKVWDLENKKCCTTLNHHTDKVQAVAWNAHSPTVLLSGSFDRSVVLTRYPLQCIKCVVTADVECLAWNPHDQHSFCLEDGTVQGFDVRVASTNPPTACVEPSFTLHAHDKPVTSISYCPTAPKLLATGSTDKMVKLWDLSNNQPSCVASKNLKAGAVFSTSFSEDCSFLLAVGGSKGDLQVWDTLTENEVARRFGKYSNRKPPPHE